jgi:hypothetical protein
MSRFEELEADEAWKEANCRLCSQCGRAVFKVDGCSTMTCGRDAADKGGGNRQDGCGKTFSWTTAKPYARSGGDTARLPKSLADVDPDHAREVKHHLVVTDDAGVLLAPRLNPALDKQTSGQYRLKCEVCALDIVGPRFACCHCPPPGLDCCLACSEDVALLAAAAPRHVAASHAFQIFFEDAAGSSAAPPPPADGGSGGGGGVDRTPKERVAGWLKKVEGTLLKDQPGAAQPSEECAVS